MAKAEGYYNRVKKELDKNSNKTDTIIYLANNILMGCCIIAEAIRNSGDLEYDEKEVKSK